jgi:hypothetical protein
MVKYRVRQLEALFGRLAAAAADRPGRDRPARGAGGGTAARPVAGPGGEGAGHCLPGRPGAAGPADRRPGRRLEMLEQVLRQRKEGNRP